MFGVLRQTVPLCPTAQCRISRCSSGSTNPRVLGVSRSLHVGTLRAAVVTKDSKSESTVEPQVDNSGPGAPGGRGGSSDGDGWKWDDGSDGRHYFSGWIVFFMAASPFVIDGLRKLSFGRDGVRILDLPAEPGMYKPIFAAAVLASTTTLTAPPPAPPPQKMSDKGGISLLGVFAILALCAGGYYIYSRRKRGSLGGPPVNDEDIQLEGFHPQNIGTRDLDPSMFSAQGRFQGQHTSADPVSAEASDIHAQSDQSQELPVEPVVGNRILESSDAKDALFGKAQGQSIPEIPSQPESENYSRPLSPAALSDTKQLSPDNVVVDKSLDQPSLLKQDTRNGDIYSDDLPTKDSFFGVRTIQNIEPPEQPDEWHNPALGPPVEEIAFQTDLDMKDKFFGVGAPDVHISIESTVEIGSMVVPESASRCVPLEPPAQQSPKEVVKVHNSAPCPDLILQDTRSGNVLYEDLEAKDAFFRPIPKTPDGETKSILDEMSDPIMKDIAQELEEDIDHDCTVQVQLHTVGSVVKLAIGEPQGSAVSQIASAIDCDAHSEQVLTVEVVESVTESKADEDSHRQLSDATESFATAEPDRVSDFVAPSKEDAPSQTKQLHVEESKSPSPTSHVPVDEATLQRTLAKLGLSPAPQKFPKGFDNGLKTIDPAPAQAPTTPTKESALKVLSRSPVLSGLDRVETVLAEEDKLVSADSKGSEDSSGSNEGQRRSGSGAKSNGDSGTIQKKRKKKRGKKKAGRTNMH